ncbi:MULTISPECIES: ribosome small subunit-dependent GTPase A [Myxococcaceae]|uniref:ribosome small subunit-dependent GTPase A n=1 Tax=Myxococcaceae TaxID=31 RepID=UPI00188F5CA4|nr:MULTISPECIES: ribosome small subunit-dependent GTPase A [Myxococcaceae]MBF5045786.1 ribosome small subunit-dependent GTPase A [Simulacricoccus sp. 17bor-14]
MLSLFDLGFGPDVQQSLDSLCDSSLVPARIAQEYGARYLTLGASGEAEAVLAGRLAFTSPERPAVGDWVAVEPGAPARIVHLLPRRTQLVRQSAGRRTHAQVLAANVDTVFVVTAAGQDFSPRRVERYLVAVQAGGAQAVVVLSKADLCPDLDARVAELEAVAPNVPVLAVSALEGRGLEGLRTRLRAGLTVAVVGSSGVGKSTLINRLLGEERLPTGGVRAADDTGRHTTTRRELVPVSLEDGSRATLVDTPGLRELQLWSEESALGSVFSDIEALAARCRFGDCTHAHEPGCAVQEAVASGALDEGRLASLHKLAREQRHQAARQDGLARQEQHRREKQFGRWGREMNRLLPKRRR